MTMRRRVLVSVLAIAFIGVSFAILFPIVLGVWSSLKAEKTLHAYYLVLDVVAAYVNTHAGHWPKNWEQLKQIAPNDRPSVWNWPDDSAEIESRIHVDFSLTSEEVAAMNTDTFTAVTQQGPNYDPNKGRVGKFLKTVRSALSGTP